MSATPDPQAPAGRWRPAFPIAIEGAGFAIPISVGGAGLLFARIDPAMVAPGLLAALLGMALMHLAGAWHGRPMVYAVRVLEASMLLGFLEQFIQKMPGWGLADTPEHRLMLVMAVAIGSALLLPLCYLLRLQRFARMMPTPVFVGFSTALALTLLISQTARLLASRQADGPWFIAVALLVLAGAIATQRLLPKWPPGVAGVALGTALALALGAAGLHMLPSLMPGEFARVLPWSQVSWRDAWAPGVATGAIVRDVVLASVSLSVLVFLNTVVNEETVSQIDGAEARPGDWRRTSAANLLATLVGSPPLTPSLGPTRAAARVGRLGWRSQCLAAALVLAVLGSGVLHLLPLAAIAGLLLFDAWSSFDRPSLRLLLRWARGRRPVLSEKEDLVTIGLVVVSAVLFTMVVGVAVGVVSGLVLYAWRNGRRLARTVETGAGVRSNCTRSRADTARLARHADRVRFVALEGALFFGAASALQALLREQYGPGRFVVVDWAHVLSADSTVANALARVVNEARATGTAVALSGLDAAGRQVGETLRTARVDAAVFPDADRALEWAENEALRTGDGTAGREGADGTSLQEALALLRGMAAEPRAALEALFEQRFFRAGETVFNAGQIDSELMVIYQGSVDILVPHGDGAGRAEAPVAARPAPAATNGLPDRAVEGAAEGAAGSAVPRGADELAQGAASLDRHLRLARLRRGAMLGELSFLDTAARAATAVATEDLLLGVLSREHFDQFARDWPEAARRLLTNLALDLAFRLRRTNHIAVSQLR